MNKLDLKEKEEAKNNKIILPLSRTDFTLRF